MPTTEQALRTLSVFGVCLLPGSADELSLGADRSGVLPGGPLDDLLTAAVGGPYEVETEAEGHRPPYGPGSPLLLLKPREGSQESLPVLAGGHRPGGVSPEARRRFAEHHEDEDAASQLPHGPQDVIVLHAGTAPTQRSGYLGATVVPGAGKRQP